MISSPADLVPTTQWGETFWSRQPEEHLVRHDVKSRLCGALLLPFRNGQPDWDGFIRIAHWLYQSAEGNGVEFVPVLNADTGYIFQLTPDLYSEVLTRFRAAYPDKKFIAGITAQTGSGSVAECYYPLLDRVQSHENCEVMIMTSQPLEKLSPEGKRDAYYELAESLVRPGVVHALEPAFVPWARPFGPWLLHQLASHPKFIGGKISTLHEPHFLYWTAMQRHLGWNFLPHSGDDFGVATAIKMGMPLLIGAACCAGPEICEVMDQWLDEGHPSKRNPSGKPGFDTQVYKKFEAIQSLCDQVFRLDAKRSAARYKHSLAHVLKLRGIIDSPEIHPQCPDQRGTDESDRMAEALLRLGTR